MRNYHCSSPTVDTTRLFVHDLGMSLIPTNSMDYNDVERQADTAGERGSSMPTTGTTNGWTPWESVDIARDVLFNTTSEQTAALPTGRVRPSLQQETPLPGPSYSTVTPSYEEDQEMREETSEDRIPAEQQTSTIWKECSGGIQENGA